MVLRTLGADHVVQAGISYITVTWFEFTPDFVRRPYLIYVDTGVLVHGDPTTPLHTLRPGEAGAVRDEFNPFVGGCPALPGVVDRWSRCASSHRTRWC
ncbi:hypothetical protein [Streptomyces eurythermus]|uniref:hypothetical protein n=1 Tax=Streptomyces eurythermus TaxID=42237 RepID=UPI0033D76D79